jgi:hypothetical protein
LAKKYPSLKSDFTDFLESLAENPTQGTPLGKDCYKIRMAISSKNKGKSGGARIITNVYVVGKPFTYFPFMTRAKNQILTKVN